MVEFVIAATDPPLVGLLVFSGMAILIPIIDVIFWVKHAL